MTRVKRTKMGWRSGRSRTTTAAIWLLATAVVVVIGRFLWTAFGAAG